MRTPGSGTRGTRPLIATGVLAFALAGSAAWRFWRAQRRLDRQRADSEEKYRVVFHHAPDAFLILGPEAVFVDCNEVAQRMLSGHRDQIVGHTPWALSPPYQFDGSSSEEKAHAILAKASRSEDTSFEWLHRRFDGKDVVVEVSMAPIQWEGEPAWFITWRDATERRRLHQELQERATTDPLTGLVNRQQFRQLAGDEIRRTRRLGHDLAVAILDIDHFKDVNDTYGHGVGDQALLEFTETCRTTIRGIDRLGRLGGDEFILLLPETGVEQARLLLERIRRAVEARVIVVDGIPLDLTVSAGVAGWRGDGDSLAELIERADQALYGAKQAGRNRTVAAEPL